MGCFWVVVSNGWLEVIGEIVLVVLQKFDCCLVSSVTFVFSES